MLLSFKNGEFICSEFCDSFIVINGYGHLMENRKRVKKMDAWKNSNDKKGTAAQAFYRPAQQKTLERLWDSGTQLFYRRDRKRIATAGAYPQGFYRTGSVKELH